MAPAVEVDSHERGSALVEMLPVLTLLLTMASLIFTLSYLIFARAWLSYQTEQALYCMAEDRPTYFCAKQLRTQAQKFLPWGQVNTNLSRTSSNRWQTETLWKFGSYQVKIRRQLQPRDILQRRDLR